MPHRACRLPKCQVKNGCEEQCDWLPVLSEATGLSNHDERDWLQPPIGPDLNRNNVRSEGRRVATHVFSKKGGLKAEGPVLR